MQATGIMGGVGDNTFAPKSDYTREQSIVTIMRLYDVVKDQSGVEPSGTFFEASGRLESVNDWVWIPTEKKTVTADGVTKTLDEGIIYIYNSTNWSQEQWEEMRPYLFSNVHIKGRLRYVPANDSIELEIVTIGLA